MLIVVEVNNCTLLLREFALAILVVDYEVL